MNEKKTTIFPWTCFIFGIPGIGRGQEQCVKCWVVGFWPGPHQCLFVALQIILKSYLNKTFMKLSEKCVTNAMLDICRCDCVCVEVIPLCKRQIHYILHIKPRNKRVEIKATTEHEKKKKTLRNVIETFGTTNNKSGKIFSPWIAINNGHSFLVSYRLWNIQCRRKYEIQ